MVAMGSLRLTHPAYQLYLFKKGKKMVKAPGKTSGRDVKRKKGIISKKAVVREVVAKVAGKKDQRPSEVQVRKVSDVELARLKKNLQTVWDAYCSPEAKETVSRKKHVSFLAVQSGAVFLNLSLVDKGILMEYELDLGSKQELAGAQIYKQDTMLVNRYFTPESGAEEILKTTNVALQTLVDILVNNDLSDAGIRNAIARGEQIQLSAA